MLEAVSLFSGAAYLLLLLLKATLAMRYIRRQQRVEWALPPGAAKRTVIVQPILGGDPQLEALLSANVDNLPADVHFLWMVDEQDPVGTGVANALAATRPNVMVMECPPAASTENPKAFKLDLALSQVMRMDAWVVDSEPPGDVCFIVLDDDTMIDERSLATAHMSLQTSDLYTGLPVYRRAQNVWGNLVTQFVNNNSVLTYLPLLNFMPPLTINGMFYAVRARTLMSVGGFRPIVNELCDDYAMRKLAARHDWRVEQGVSFQQLSTSVESGVRYMQIMHRWFVFALQLVKDQTLAVKLLLLTLLGAPPLLLILFLGSTLAVFGAATNGTEATAAFAVMAIALTMRQALLWSVQRWAGSPRLPFQPGLSLAAELAQPFQALGASLFPTIQWRSRRIRIGPGHAFRIVGEGES